MSAELDPNALIAEHESDLKFHVRYVLHTTRGYFQIYIYHTQYLKGIEHPTQLKTESARSPFAIWDATVGLQALRHYPFYELRDSLIVRQIEEFCKTAHAAWKEGQS